MVIRCALHTLAPQPKVEVHSGSNGIREATPPEEPLRDDDPVLIPEKKIRLLVLMPLVSSVIEYVPVIPPNQRNPLLVREVRKSASGHNSVSNSHAVPDLERARRIYLACYGERCSLAGLVLGNSADRDNNAKKKQTPTRQHHGLQDSTVGAS